MGQVAALTMVWNEAHFLPIWLRHYSRQVGAENCYVIDHGSDDGSTLDIGPATRIRLPRTALDEVRRANCVSDIAAALLNYYEVVCHSDVDELLVGDPVLGTTLCEVAAKIHSPVSTAVGLDVMHDTQSELPIDAEQPVSLQRTSIRFVSPICKPAMIRRPVRWRPGFHSADAEIKFEPIFLFHLRRYDLEQGLRRLAKTRTVVQATPGANDHQSVSDEQFTSDLVYLDHAGRRTDVSLFLSDEPLRAWVQRIEAEQVGREGHYYRLSLSLLEDQLWRLPERFVDSF